jgi:hypothetical protein
MPYIPNLNDIPNKFRLQAPFAQPAITDIPFIKGMP